LWEEKGEKMRESRRGSLVTTSGRARERKNLGTRKRGWRTRKNTRRIFAQANAYRKRGACRKGLPENEEIFDGHKRWLLSASATR